MPEIKNAFLKGKMNKDLDERLIPNGEYRDALNIDVDFSESSDVGALKNILGNTQKDSISLTSATCIGNIKDTENDKIYWFITSSAKDIIAEYDVSTEAVDAVLVDTGNILNFNTNNLITGVSILDGILYFTDNLNEPKQVDIAYWKTQTSDFNTLTTGLTEERITLIKKSPLAAPTLNMNSSLRNGAGTAGNATVTVSLNLGSTTGIALVNSKESGEAISGTFSVAPNYKANDIIILTFDFTSADGDITQTEARIKLDSNYVTSSTSFSAELLTISKLVRGASVAYTCILQEDDPLFELKFPRFAYRYKYNNGQYSCFSPFSNAAFLPDSTVGNNTGFEYNAEDGYNLAMVNTLRSLTLEDLNNNISSDVEEIDVLYKDSVGNNVYVVDTIKRISGNIADTFEVKDEQIFKVLPANQLLRLFDSVPKKAKALDISANRLIFGNYTHQFDLPSTIPTFDIKLVNRYATDDINRNQRQSIKSNRKYQIGVVYYDDYGRSTPVLTDKSGIIKVPIGQSKNLTKFNAKITSSAPSFAKNFKYFIKEISKVTYNLCVDSFYQDDQGYMYISLPSSEINKVKEEDILLIKKKTGTEFANTSTKFKVLDKLTTPPAFLSSPLEVSYRPHKFAYSFQFGDGTEQTTIKAGSTPVPNSNTITLLSFFKVGDSKIEGSGTFGLSDNGVSAQAIDAVNPGKKVKFIRGEAESDVYTVKSVEVHNTGGDDIEIHFEEEFGNDVLILYEDYVGNELTAEVGGMMVGLEQENKSGSAEFEGRFFLKLKADNNLLAELKGTNVENLNAISATQGVDGDFGAYDGSGGTTSGAPADADRQYCIRAGGQHNANSSTTNNISVNSGGFQGSMIDNTAFGSPVLDYTIGWHFSIGTSAPYNDPESLYSTHDFNINLKEGNYVSFHNKVKNDGTTDDGFYKIEQIDIRDHTDGRRFWTLKLDRNLDGRLPAFMNQVGSNDSSIPHKFSIIVHEFKTDSLKNITNPPIFEVEPQDDVDIDLYYETQEIFSTGARISNSNDILASIGVDGGHSIANQQNLVTKVTLSDNDRDALRNETVGYEFETNYFNNLITGNVDHFKIMFFDTGDVLKTMTIGVDDDNETTSFSNQTIITSANDHGLVNNLSYYNCFSFENGVESFVIRDDFNAPALGKGVRVSTIFEDNYQEENLKSGLIFSQIYNGKTGINKLNQFIIAEPIIKNLNPGYGSVQLLHTRYNDIIAYCEDKVIKILTNKDALFNADGSANVTSNQAVLGQAIPYNSNYGIGINPESFADFTYRGYFVDKKNGIVVRHSADGMEEVSNFGMKDYFRDNLRNQAGYIYGSYDEKKSQYNVSLPSVVNTTVSYSESVKGWPSRKSFLTEGGISINGQYFTFKNGHIYKHHTGTINTFYSSKTDSEVTFIFNESPANVKNFRTLNYEGDTGWTCESIVTNKQDGQVTSFIEKEGKFYNYISGVEETESTIDVKALNAQGIGNLTSQIVDGSNRVFTYSFNLNNDIQINDKLYYVDASNNKQNLGSITAINTTNKTITITNTGEVPQASAYMFYVKNAKFNTSGILGYYAEATMKNTATTTKELYSVGSEVSISS